ncbi:hypothetical protein ODJ79_36245 [Actinoplanes sp. KI2]|uniref:hypothetical protein n=1 Tax=Actinoplanes sp. KI2 TaxID=2983315 RepID=UPI0021D5EB13|nr:hypothetical protein [Actinoplanes sp. KI2]MCU7729197.1 hypothetical protein [Actinoplanes sp. KI2]
MALLVRCRRAVAAALAAVLGLLTLTTTPDLADFARAADLLLHGRFGEVYAQPWNQAGPAQLLISRVLMIGASPDGTLWPPLVALWSAALVAGVMWLCRGDVRREAVAGLLGLLWVAVPMPWNGHPAELAVPVLWAYAIVCQRRGRDLAAAALLALGVAIAPWAVIAVPGLLAAARPLRALRAGALAVVMSVACYLPFVLTGQFAMFRYRWGVAPGTVASLLGLTEAGWWLRPVQGLVMVAGVAMIAWRMRGARLAIAAVPLAAALLRVATDPVAQPYYWYPAAVASLLLLAMMRRWVLAAVLAYGVLLGESVSWPLATGLACLGLLVAVTPLRWPAFRRVPAAS